VLARHTARKRLPLLAVLAATAASVALAGCGSDRAAAGAQPKVTLSLVAYSTPQAAYEKIIKAFQQTAAGRGVVFTQSYGASGDQSRAVAAGLAADVVAFSLEPDITRLVKADLVDPSWSSGPRHGFVTDSVVVLATRKGNPKHIADWSDLTRDGVQVITPNPFTSGGARWNVLAAYGAVSGKGSQKAVGVSYLNDLFHHVAVQDDSARKALQTFVGGKGDVMLAYENEAIFAQQKQQPLDYTVPADTILIENPVAVTSTSKHPAEAKAFVDFLYSAQAQRIFADQGYRPVVAGVAKSGEFPTPSGLFTIADLGGWTSVTAEFFDPKTGVLAGVERDLGVPTQK
jgi:sulfate transport system substrate-binding protein